MSNNVLLVGRLANEPKMVEMENGRSFCMITLAVVRSYKNSEGVYDTDFIDCKLWDSIATPTIEYCRKGDVIGVRGRLETRIIEKNDEEVKIYEVIADKVTFLSSKKVDE